MKKENFDSTTMANIRQKIAHVYFYDDIEINDGRLSFVIIAEGGAGMATNKEGKVLQEFIDSAVDEFNENAPAELMDTMFVASLNHFVNDKLFNITIH